MDVIKTAFNLLLPLETRGVENVRSEKPRNDKEPTAKS